MEDLVGIERIKILASEIKDKPLLKIVDYLISRVDMDEKYLNEEKTLKQMISFIKGEARKQAEDECAMLENEEVYSMAIHYWDETNEQLGIKKEPSEEEIKAHNEAEKQKLKEIKKRNKEQLSNIEANNKALKKEWIPEGQLSLFDL